MASIPRGATAISIGMACEILTMGFSVAADSLPERIEGNRDTIAVIDGDTIQVGAYVVQLAGIDAPEIGQICVHESQPWHCGLVAANTLHKHIQLTIGDFVCVNLKPLKDGVIEATCESGKTDLSVSMLLSGHAIVAEGTGILYREIETQARDAKLGIWGGEFVPPQSWREGTRLSEESRFNPSSCVIVGVHSDNGARIYLVPSDARYPDVIETADRDVPHFCSDEEARARGWERPNETARW